MKLKQNIYHLCLVFAYVCVCFTLHLDVIYLITQQIKYQVDFHRKMICICTGFLYLVQKKDNYKLSLMRVIEQKIIKKRKRNSFVIIGKY